MVTRDWSPRNKNQNFYPQIQAGFPQIIIRNNLFFYSAKSA